MSTWLRMLLIGGITAAACGDVNSVDEVDMMAERESNRTERAPSSGTNRAMDAGLQDSGARISRDAGHTLTEPAGRDMTVDAEPDAEVHSDLDAGFPELEGAILRDCTETLRCDTEPPSSLEECIAVSTSALGRATPKSRERFAAIVMRCDTQRGCDYVSCTRQP